MSKSVSNYARKLFDQMTQEEQQATLGDCKKFVEQYFTLENELITYACNSQTDECANRSKDNHESSRSDCESQE